MTKPGIVGPTEGKMMKLKPKKCDQERAYPNAMEYNHRMRQVLACLAVAGTGMMLNEALAEDPKKEVKKDAGAVKKGTPEEAKKLALEKVRKEVQANATKLGVTDFRVRREATSRLIAIGSVVEKPAKNAPKKRNQKPVKPYRDIVIQEMVKLSSHKDPEVKERSKLIITALTPKPFRINRPRIGGAMRAR
jgi:hypothetical protein